MHNVHLTNRCRLEQKNQPNGASSDEQVSPTAGCLRLVITHTAASYSNSSLSGEQSTNTGEQNTFQPPPGSHPAALPTRRPKRRSPSVRAPPPPAPPPHRPTTQPHYVAVNLITCNHCPVEGLHLRDNDADQSLKQDTVNLKLISIRISRRI